MSDLKNLKAAALSAPQVAKLKALGKGIKIGVVWGRRLLIKPVVPYTDMDRVEAAGLIAVPESVKRVNTPLPSTGIVVQVGVGVGDEGYNSDEREIFQPGTGVLFSKYAGLDFVIEGADYKIIPLDEIMATFEVEEGDEVIVPLADPTST